MVPSPAILTKISPQALCAGLLGSLSRDIEYGIVGQARFRDYYQPQLQPHLDILRDLSARKPHLQRDCNLVIRFLTHPGLRRKAVVPSLKLRTAADAICVGLQTVLNADEKKEVPALTHGMGLLGNVATHIPPPEEVLRSLQQFNPELKQALHEEAHSIIHKPKGKKHPGSDLEHSPFLLRAAIIAWMIKSSQSSALKPHLMAEVFEWLTHVPKIYGHDFFQMLFRHPSIRSKGRTNFFRSLMNQVNGAQKTSYYLSGQSLSGISKKGKPFRKGLYQIKKLAVAVNLHLLSEMTSIVPDEAIRNELLNRSGMTKEFFYSADHMRDGLACALVALNPIGRPDLDGTDILFRARCIASIFDFISQHKTSVNFRDFFHVKVVELGLPTPEQHKLIDGINQLLGTEYKFPSTGSSRIPDGKSKSLFRIGQWVINPGIGIGLIQAVEEISIGGKNKICYIVAYRNNIAQGIIPRRNARLLGLRSLSKPLMVKRALVILTRQQTPSSAQNIQKRRAVYATLIKEGSLEKMAELLRLICTQEHEYPKMGGAFFPIFQKTLKMFCLEIALITGSPLQQVRKDVEAALH